MLGLFVLIGMILRHLSSGDTVDCCNWQTRSAEPTVEAVTAFNPVDLALCAPENPFVDIIRAFPAINRTVNPDDPRLSNNMVRHRFEVFHFISDSLHRIRSLLHRLGWRTAP